MPKHRDAVLVRISPLHLRAMLVRSIGVLQSLPRVLLPGWVILFIMGFRSATMCVRRNIVQLGSSLMVFVVRSVVITSRH